jgi:thiosulfate/3-mercaptopyruvate sulfurtransferase
MLVSTDELAKHLEDPTWIVFDCRHDLGDFEKGARLYRAGHIPGAHFAPVESELSGPKTGRNGRHPLPEPQAFADFLARHGASDRSTIVAYDDVGGQYAARLWWLARWIGLDRVKLLDGGFPKWQAEGRPLSTSVPVAKPSLVRAKAHPEMVCNVSELQEKLRGPAISLIDARTAERWRGETEPIDRIAGRVPGSINRFFKGNLKADQTFRPATEIRRELETLLPHRGANVVHMCGSGVTACVNLFAMEYAGLPGSRLYPGSWSEWIADPARPIGKG